MKHVSRPAAPRSASALVHREIYQLGGLIVLVVAAFLLTRTIAISTREMTLRDAAEWYRRGHLAMQAGRTDEAIGAPPRRRPQSGQHAICAGARARARAPRTSRTRRASAPFPPRRGPGRPGRQSRAGAALGPRKDPTDALRFYHDALDALWPAEMAGARRAVRLELARFLSAQQSGARRGRMLALSGDMPDEGSRCASNAQLFAKAGDNAHALDEFQRVLRLDAGPQAIAGAGQAAFNLGDYPRAARCCTAFRADAGDAAHAGIVDLVLSSDPLANRLGSTERRRRLGRRLVRVAS